MMTSWNETGQIEDYILGSANAGDKLLFEARLILEPELEDKVIWQRHTYKLVQRYGRKQLKQEIEAIHQQLFTKPEHVSFSQKIRSFFTNQK